MWMTEKDWWKITTTVGVVSIGRGGYRLLGYVEDCYRRGWDFKVEMFEQEPDLDHPPLDVENLKMCD